MRMLLLALALMLLGAAAAETRAEFGSAQVISRDEMGAYQWYTVEYPSGEQAVVTLDINENVISVVTSVAAQPADTQPQDRLEAESAVLAEYPDALVLFGEDGEGGAKILHIISPELAGAVTVHGGVICSRNLEYGRYFRDGRLTMDGAMAAMAMHRPEAEIRAVELDEDDGVWCYEGEAYVGGVEYEFEINATSGRLLEWERD